MWWIGSWGALLVVGDDCTVVRREGFCSEIDVAADSVQRMSVDDCIIRPDFEVASFIVNSLHQYPSETKAEVTFLRSVGWRGYICCTGHEEHRINRVAVLISLSRWWNWRY